MSMRPPRPDRPDSREVAALKQIKSDQPDLAAAVDLQLELVLLQRRIQGRIRTPWFDYDAEWLLAQQREGRPILRFGDIPLDWSDLRLMCRQTTDLLRRYEAIERDDHDRIQGVLRSANALEPLVKQWFESKAAPAGTSESDLSNHSSGERREAEGEPYNGLGAQHPNALENARWGPRRSAPKPTTQPAEGAEVNGTSRAAPLAGSYALEQVFSLAMRPFLERCADVAMQRFDLSAWMRAYCPLCGGDPEMAVITQSGDRRLICGRCTAQWRFHPLACPFCNNEERHLITSFASRDGRYRLYACDVCRRYVKAYDGRKSDRPVMLSVDSIATLPLDAAAQQKGYVG